MKKITIALVIINGVQFLTGIAIWLYLGITRLDETGRLLLAAISLMLICNIASFIGLYLSMKYKNRDLEESLHNLEQLNATLRMQRHDYLNHFQVLYGLMELQEYEEAQKYLAPVFKDIRKVSCALKTAQPAVNALIQVKMDAAQKAGIDFYPEIRSELRLLPLEAWNLCKILANLLDNSIYALQETGQEEKRIRLEIRENPGDYYFTVSNNGPQIPLQLTEKIFRSGVTTKKEEGHGMGLYIVSQIVKEAEGEIRLTSDERETSFEIRLPKREPGKKAFSDS